jgi:hypothetical protein
MTDKTAAKDYAAMTDGELNREVAERLGYRAAETQPNHWELYYPGGVKAIQARDEQTLWTEATGVGRWNCIPHYATDLNDVAALDFGVWIVTLVIHAGNDVEVELLTPAGKQVYVLDAREARARTIAWLLYKDAQS